MQPILKPGTSWVDTYCRYVQVAPAAFHQDQVLKLWGGSSTATAWSPRHLVHARLARRDRWGAGLPPGRERLDLVGRQTK